MPSPNFSFLKNTINFEMANVFSIFVFLQYLPLVTISKKSWGKGGIFHKIIQWFDMELSY